MKNKTKNILIIISVVIALGLILTFGKSQSITATSVILKASGDYAVLIENGSVVYYVDNKPATVEEYQEEISGRPFGIQEQVLVEDTNESLPFYFYIFPITIIGLIVLIIWGLRKKPKRKKR